MKEGSILRLRNFRNYGGDGKSYVEYSCNVFDEKTGRSKRQKDAEKEVFVALLLGCEPLVLDEEREQHYTARIDEALLKLGFMPIDDAIAAGADPKKLKFELIENLDRKEKGT